MTPEEFITTVYLVAVSLAVVIALAVLAHKLLDERRQRLARYPEVGVVLRQAPKPHYCLPPLADQGTVWQCPCGRRYRLARAGTEAVWRRYRWPRHLVADERDLP